LGVFEWTNWKKFIIKGADKRDEKRQMVFPEICQSCYTDGHFQDNFCDDCVISSFGDQSVQAKRRGIGMFATKTPAFKSPT